MKPSLEMWKILGFYVIGTPGRCLFQVLLCLHYFAVAVALLRVSEPNCFLPEMSDTPVISRGLAFGGSTVPSSPLCLQQETSLCNKMTHPPRLYSCSREPVAVAKD